jgi:NTE family protein
MQGRNIEEWERPKRRSVATRLTVDHVMGSAALPFFFPAIRIEDSWHGDGGIRLTAPLSPALHLGAHKILAISTRLRSLAGRSKPAAHPRLSATGAGAEHSLQRDLPRSHRSGRAAPREE